MSAAWLGKHQKSQGMCPDASTSPFRSSANSGKKGSGVTPVHVSANDMMKRIVSNTRKGIRDAAHDPGSAAALLAAEIDMDMDGTSIGNGQYVLIDGSNFQCPAAPVGLAEKKHKKGGNQRHTTGQLHFLGCCYTRGVKTKAYKMSPKQASDAMEMHGTTAGASRYPGDLYCARSADGKPAFRIGELLEHWTFRSCVVVWATESCVGSYFERVGMTSIMDQCEWSQTNIFPSVGLSLNVIFVLRDGEMVGTPEGHTNVYTRQLRVDV